MQASNVPAKIQTPFAVSGSKRTIPIPSQISVTPGAASFTDGFPPLTMTALTAGGIPPAGQDFNGVLNAITLIQQWASAGGTFAYDATWSTANNGYPKGAVLLQAGGSGFWLCTTDNNTSNPDTGTPTGWAPLDAVGIAAITGLAATNVTLTPAQYGLPIVLLTGTLTANVQIIFPAIAGTQWQVINNTTGAFIATVKTSAGTGLAVPQGGGVRTVWGDGTNLNSLAPTNAVNIARFTSSSSWTAPAGVTTAYVSGCAGGAGGGGGGGATNIVGVGAGGAGGGAGQATTRQQITVVPGTPYSVTIGAGGTAGTGGSPGVAGGNGGAGGNTTFGALLTLTGASLVSGGGSYAGSVAPAGGSYGAGFPSGSMGADGATGFTGGVGNGGAGASSPFGGGGGSGRAGSTGAAGQGAQANSGGGGGGGGGGYGTSGAGANGGAGAAGGSGFLVIEW